MYHKVMIALAAAMAAAVAPAGAEAQPNPPPSAPAAPALTQRAEQVVALLKGAVEPASLFTPDFLAQVPPAQVAAVVQQLTAANGAPQRVAAVEPTSQTEATIRIEFAQAIVSMNMSIEAAPPHRVAGLVVTGSEPRGTDSAAAIIQELEALPGSISFSVARLGDGGPVQVAAHRPEQALAIGSTFKLIILAELSRQVKTGQRRWSDVTPVDRHSLPSGLLQDWPLGSPATLHTLAALMISRSDNTATDVLLRLAGRENIERMMTRIGMASAARNRPFLSTVELFQLKADTAEARNRWTAGDAAARRRLLDQHYGARGAPVDMGAFATAPVAIDSVEWFASASDLVKVMDWLRRNGDATTQGIMAISPGAARDVAGQYAYLGFKGGSEPGVINLTYLLRSKGGAWYVVTGGWNNPAAAVDENRFLGLMTRALRLVR